MPSEGQLVWCFHACEGTKLPSWNFPLTFMGHETDERLDSRQVTCPSAGVCKEAHDWLVILDS